jgi:hypothetical protein
MALYTVERGDSVWNIAEKSLGMQYPGQPLDPNLIAQEMQKIIGLNLPKLKNNPELIYSGLVLDIGGSPTPGQAVENGKGSNGKKPQPSAFPEGEGVGSNGNIAGQGQQGGGRNLSDERDERIAAAGSERESIPELNDGKRTQEPWQYGQGQQSNIPSTGWNYQQPNRGMMQAPPPAGGGPGGAGGNFPPGSVFSGGDYDINGNLMGEEGYRPPAQGAPFYTWGRGVGGGGAPAGGGPAGTNAASPVPGTGGLSAADVYQQGRNPQSPRATPYSPGFNPVWGPPRPASTPVAASPVPGTNGMSAAQIYQQGRYPGRSFDANGRRTPR